MNEGFVFNPEQREAWRWKSAELRHYCALMTPVHLHLQGANV